MRNQVRHSNTSQILLLALVAVLAVWWAMHHFAASQILEGSQSESSGPDDHQQDRRTVSEARSPTSRRNANADLDTHHAGFREYGYLGRPYAGERSVPRSEFRKDQRRESIAARLADPDPDARIAAIHEVFELETQRAIPLLQQILITEKDHDVYEEALAALDDIAGEDAIIAVTTAIDAQDADRRREAVDAFGQIGAAAAHLLGQALFGDPDPALRLRAAHHLANMSSPAAIALLRTAGRDPDPEVRRAAGGAIAAWDRRNELPRTVIYPDAYQLAEETMADPPEQDFFSALSGNSDIEQKIEAVRELLFLNDELAVRALKLVLERDEATTVREEALVALQSIGSSAADEVIEVALGDDSPEMRRRAIETLWQADTPNILPILGQTLYADPDPALRLEALRLLGSDRSPAARTLILLGQSDSEEEIRILATRLSRD
jgi:HEAT repeat protein